MRPALCNSVCLTALLVVVSACVPNRYRPPPPVDREPIERAGPPRPEPAPRFEPTTVDPTPEPGSYGHSTETGDQIPGSAVTGLRVRAGRGNLTIVADQESTMVSVRAEIETRAESAAEAKRIAREVAVRFTSRDTESPALIVPEPRLTGSQDYSAHLTLRLPPAIHLKVENTGGDVEISGLSQGLELFTSGGQVEVHNVEGGIEVHNSGPTCEIREVTGRIEIDDGPGDLAVAFVTGEIIIDDQGGELTVHSVDGNVTARNNPGRPHFFSIEGNLTLVGISHNRAKVEDVSGSVVYPSTSD